MFLTKIDVNPIGYYAEAILTPYRAHGILCAIFPDEPRLLYRVEHNVYANQLTVLAQSQSRPAAEWLVENKNFAVNLRTKAYDPTFQEGEVLMFRLVTEPVIRQRDRVCKVPKTGNELLAWLRQRQQGFEILQASPVQVKTEMIRKDRNTVFPLTTVQFDGQLRVNDPETMRKAVENGIGRSKYVGCGLLSVAR